MRRKNYSAMVSNQSISEEELKESTEMFYRWEIMLPEQLKQIQENQIQFYWTACKAIKNAADIFHREYYTRQMQRTLEVINKAERLMEFSGYEYVPFVPYC